MPSYTDLCFLMVILFLKCGDCAVENTGREFVICFMDNYSSGISKVYLTSDSRAEVTITTPLFDRSWKNTTFVEPGSVAYIEVPNSLRGKGISIENKAVYINASADISVIGVNQDVASTDAFIAFPIASLGRDYIAVTWNEKPAIMIAAVNDGTHVSFEFPVGYKSSFTYKGTQYMAGDKLEIILNRFQTFHIYSVDGDLSGTTIIASAKVSAYSGNTVTLVEDSSTIGAADHLVDQLVPTEGWGKQFVAFTTPGRLFGDYIRVLAKDDKTTYTFNSNTYKLDKLSYRTHNVPSDTYYWISSDKGISVVQFSKSSTNGDPAMSIVVPVPLYTREITWSTITTASGGEYTNYIVLISKRTYTAELYLDNATIAASWTSVKNNPDYVATYIKITPGIHRAYNSNPIHGFLGMAMGNGYADSYAFPSGMRFANINEPCTPTFYVAGDGIDNDCDGYIDEELHNGIDDDNDGKIDEDLYACSLRTTDVAFILDASRSEGDSNFQRQIDYVNNFILSIPYGSEDFRFSVVSFSTTAIKHFSLNTYFPNSTDIMVAHVNNITFESGPSYIGEAFRAVREGFMRTEHGARNNSKKYVVALTDGLLSNFNDAASRSNDLKSDRVNIIPIGVGRQVRHQSLIDMSSDKHMVLTTNTKPKVLRSIIRLRGMAAECNVCYWTTADVAILLEASPDVTIPIFQTHIQAVKELIKAIPVGRDSVRISYSRFGADISEEFDFDSYFTVHSIITSILKPHRLSRLNGPSNITHTLKTLRDKMFLLTKGHRQNAKRIAILFVDGTFNNEASVEKETLKVKETGVTLVVVSSNISVNMTLLTQLASDSAYVYIVGTEAYTNLDVLHSLVGMMRYETCDVDL